MASASGAVAPRVLLWGGRTKARLLATLTPEAYPGATVDVYEPAPIDARLPEGVRRLRTFTEVARRWSTWTHFIAAIGGEHGFARVFASEVLAGKGLAALPVICETSTRHPTAEVGTGVQLMARSHVGLFSALGDYAIVNTAAIIDHDCHIGRGVHVMGGCALASYVSVDDYASIGTNATVLPHRRIGEGAFVGAGSVVTRDIPPWCVAFGSPARVVRERRPPTPGEVMDAMAPRSWWDAGAGD